MNWLSGYSLNRGLKGHIFDSLFLHLSPKRHFGVKRCNLAGLAPLMRRRWCCYRPRHNGTSLHFTQTLLMQLSKVLVHVHKFTPVFVLENTLFTMHAMCYLWVNFDSYQKSSSLNVLDRQAPSKNIQRCIFGVRYWGKSEKSQFPKNSSGEGQDVNHHTLPPVQWGNPPSSNLLWWW